MSQPFRTFTHMSKELSNPLGSWYKSIFFTWSYPQTEESTKLGAANSDDDCQCFSYSDGTGSGPRSAGHKDIG